MKQKTIFYLILLIALLFGCTSNRQSPDILPFIDIRKNYTEKEIILTDIADVNYLHLNTQNEEYLYSGGIQDVTENTILVFDWSSGSILFFSKDGNPKTRFNRYGQGPEEYLNKTLFNGIYDEARDEVYVPVDVIKGHYIQVYSSTGKYKRKLNLQGIIIGLMVHFDDESLLIYDRSKLLNKASMEKTRDVTAFLPQLNDSSFILISKFDGKVLEYIEMPCLATDFSISSETGGIMWPIYQRIVKCSNGFLLCNPENDTIYLYKQDKSLTPILRKIPLLSDTNIRVLDNCIDTGKYQFMKVSRRRTSPRREDANEMYYMRDKETGEVFRQKIVLPDYKGKEFFIHAAGGGMRYLENGYQFSISLSELKQANRENRLSGKLKELVAALNEDTDNNIFMFVKFK